MLVGILRIVKGISHLFSVLTGNCRIIICILLINQLRIFDTSPHPAVKPSTESSQSVPVYSILRQKIKETNCTDADDDAYRYAGSGYTACQIRNSSETPACPDIILLCPSPVCDSLPVAHHLGSSSMNQFGTYDCWYGGDAIVYGIVGLLLYCFILEALVQLVLLFYFLDLEERMGICETDSWEKAPSYYNSRCIWMIFTWVYRPGKLIAYTNLYVFNALPKDTDDHKAAWIVDLIALEFPYVLASVFTANYVEASSLAIFASFSSIFRLICVIFHLWFDDGPEAFHILLDEPEPERKDPGNYI